MGFLGTLIFYLFAWFFIRLKTKKMTIIRLAIATPLLILYSVVLGLICDDEKTPVIIIVIAGIAVGLFGLRVLTDIIFLIKGKFEEKENLKERYFNNNNNNDTKNTLG